MNAVDTKLKSAQGDTSAPIPVPFFIKGEVVYGDAVRHVSRDLGVEFATPDISLDALVTPRTELPPLLDVPLKEIIDFLVETSQRLDYRTNPYMAECLERTARTNPLPKRVVSPMSRTTSKVF